jgi:uncharacterized Zn finger protein
MYYNYRPYVSVAERRRKAEKAAAKMNKKGEKMTPIRIDGRTIAKTFWGKAWCDHLESFSDYENRLPRGRTYVRNGSVIHLSIDKGKIEALVQGSSLYKIKIEISSVESKRWQQILNNCSGQIDSVIELLQGKLSSGVMNTITNRQKGLFPQPKEISLDCSCPDWADMCKHVAAVLYGVGARLDEEPELLFKLRHVDHLDLINKATLRLPTKCNAKTQVIEDQDLSNLFGIEIDPGNADIPIAENHSVKSQIGIQKRALRNGATKKLKRKTPGRKASRGTSKSKK